MILYLTQHIYELTPYKEAYKYPFIATEILSSKNKIIENNFLKENNDENYVLKMIKVLDNKDILNTTIPGYINKIIISHIDNEIFCDIISKNKEIIFNIFLKYVYNDSYRDLFYSIFNEFINKGRKEFSDYVSKLFEVLLLQMKNYIKNENNDEKYIDITVEMEDGIYNIIYILIKLANNNEEIMNLIINKLNEGILLQDLKKDIKDDINNLKIFNCLNYLMILIANLLNIIITKKEKNIYAFNKYYLCTIFDPPYSLNNYITNFLFNNKTDNENANKEKDKEDNIEMKQENDNKINLDLLIDISINYLFEINAIFEQNIKVIPNINKSIIYSAYDKITDLLILIKINIIKENPKLINLFNDILLSLVQIIIDHPEYSLINNKTLQIFKLITKDNLSIEKEKILIYLKNILTEKKLNEIITDNGVISNNDIKNSNNIYLVNILNLLEKQENLKISKFLEKTNEGLYENEKMENSDYVPKPDEEEIIFEKKKDLHDTEGFIFTPKKVIEDSKQIMKNLKEFDK